MVDDDKISTNFLGATATEQQAARDPDMCVCTCAPVVVGVNGIHAMNARNSYRYITRVWDQATGTTQIHIFLI